MAKLARVALLLGAVAAVPGLPTRAQDPAPGPAAEPPGPVEEQAPRSQGPVGLTLQLGLFTGTGAGIQLGTPAVGLRAAAGWAPELLAVEAPGDDSPKLRFYSTFLVAPDLYVRLARPRATTDLGLQLGYRWNSLLGQGGAAGAYAQIGAGKVDILVSGGLLVFPDGEDRLRKEKKLPGAKFAFPGPNVNLAVSVGLLFFP